MTPNGKRDTLLTIAKLPEPDYPTMNIIREDVEQTFEDSSDDEHF